MNGLINIEKMFKSTKELSPEKNLMIAILQESIRGLTCSDPKLPVESQEWFASNDDEYIFSFASICETLGFAPDWMRQNITNPTRRQRWARNNDDKPDKFKREYRRLGITDMSDLPGHTYTHEYGACPPKTTISKCPECRQRYQAAYKKVNPDIRLIGKRREMV